MKNHKNQLIAISGGSGAGKTWLAEWLLRALGADAARLSLDDFYHDHSAWPLAARTEINFDHPDAIDWPLFAQVLDACRRGCPVGVPRYNFATHARTPHRELFVPAPLVLVDGLWLLWLPQIAARFDLKIFLNCPAQLRLERRLARDVAERGRSADSVQVQFAKTVAPMHDQFVAPQAERADLVLQAPPDNAELCELVEMLELSLRPAAASAPRLCGRGELHPV